MTGSSIHPLAVSSAIAIEQYEIHDACCRYKRQNLSCSTCGELYERACRAFYAAEAQRLAEAA